MKKAVFPLIQLFFLFSPLFIFSQDTLQQKNNSVFYNNYSENPLFVIKGDEIRRFPSTNFLDAIEGIFPLCFSSSTTNNYLFVINGFVQADINGLSLNDIEDVAFTSTLDGNLVPFSRPGTFYIKTKKATSKKAVIEYNPQFNLIHRDITKNDALLSPNITNLKSDIHYNTGHFFQNQFSLKAAPGKWNIYASAQVDALKFADLNNYTISKYMSYIDTNTLSSKTKQLNFKAFLQAEYKISDKLTAGITGTFFKGDVDGNIDNTFHRSNYINYSSNLDQDNKLLYHHIGGFIKWEPLRRLRNKFSIEFQHNDLDIDSTQISTSVFTGNGGIHISNKLATVDFSYKKRYVLRDQLEYDILTKGKFKLSSINTFTYLHSNPTLETSQKRYADNDPSFASYSKSWSNYKEKLTILNPALYFSCNNLVSGGFGYGFILNKGAAQIESKYRRNFYSNLDFNLKKLFNLSETFNRLYFYASYSDTRNNNSNNYFLPFYSNQSNFDTYVGSTGEAPSNGIGLKNKQYSLKLNSVLLENKLTAGIEWIKKDEEAIYYFPVDVPFGWPSAWYEVTGISSAPNVILHTGFQIINKSLIKWNTRFNISYPTKQKFKIAYLVDTEVKNPVYAGWQNDFHLGNMYVQMNAIIDIDKYYPTLAYENGNLIMKENRHNELRLNYFLIGYDFALSKTNASNKKVSLFLQGRNLLYNKKVKELYSFDQYGGIGANFKF